MTIKDQNAASSSSIPPVAASNVTALTNPTDIIFQTAPRYSPLLVVLWAIFPIFFIVMFTLPIFSATPVWDNSDDETDGHETTYRNENDETDSFVGAAPILIFIPIMLGIVYSVSLPRDILLQADATLIVKTTCTTWKFDQVIDASASWNAEPCKSRCKMATALTGAVTVRRPAGKWNVLLTPKDVTGLLQAIQTVAAVRRDTYMPQTAASHV